MKMLVWVKLFYGTLALCAKPALWVMRDSTDVESCKLRESVRLRANSDFPIKMHVRRRNSLNRQPLNKFELNWSQLGGKATFYQMLKAQGWFRTSSYARSASSNLQITNCRFDSQSQWPYFNRDSIGVSNWARTGILAISELEPKPIFLVYAWTRSIPELEKKNNGYWFSKNGSSI